MKNKILLVDDEQNVLQGYIRQLRQEREQLEIFTADSGKRALEILAAEGTFAVVISDFRMPVMDGVEFLERVNAEYPDTVRIMLTGQADFDSIIDVINRGNIFRFLTKPCSPDVLIPAISSGIKQFNLIQSEKILLNKTLSGSIKMMTDILAISRPGSFNKAQRIRKVIKSITDALSIENKWQVEVAAMLSQVGCVTIPDNILEKVYENKRLSPEETKIFMNHAVVASDMLSKIPRLEEVASIVKYQEKEYGGKGFPIDGIKGDSIPLGARILKLVLDYDKLMLENFLPETAAAELENAPGKYDPQIVPVFKSLILNKRVAQPHEYEKKPEVKAVRGVPALKLKPGMILAEDLIADNNESVAAKNQVITEALLAKILNYLDNKLIPHTINVYSIRV